MLNSVTCYIIMVSLCHKPYDENSPLVVALDYAFAYAIGAGLIALTYHATHNRTCCAAQ